MTRELLSCGLCGMTDRDVEPFMAWFREPVERDVEVTTFRGRHVDQHETRRVMAHVDAMPRCRDRQACRARVEAAGGTWELLDGTVPTARPAGLEPSSIAEPAGMSAEEVESWLA